MYAIRRGQKYDIPAVFELINELALYERAPEQVTNTVAMMEEDGFGKHPVYGFFVAERADTGKIIGTAIYYYRYSTWKGKRLYLEDYIVTESERGKGAGKLLFERVMRQCLEDGCTGMMWQVLDWNEPAIHFYKKYSSEFDSGWINCHLQAAEIERMLDRE
jgi:GNAT superfamily N-acetyltransferase